MKIVCDRDFTVKFAGSTKPIWMKRLHTFTSAEDGRKSYCVIAEVQNDLYEYAVSSQRLAEFMKLALDNSRVVPVSFIQWR